MTRKMYAGAAPATTLNGGINSTTTTIVVTSGTGYPSGSTGNFWIVIDRGLSTEEKILCSSTVGTTITAVDRTSSANRDSTTNVSHNTLATVEHCFTAQDADEANAHINTTSQDNHTQYLLVDGTRAPTGVTAIAAIPGSSAVGDSASKGAGPTLATSNHVHGREAFATPVATGAANAAGAATTVPRSDHVHLAPNTLGFAAHTASYTLTTGFTDVTNATVTVTTVAGRRYKVTAHVHAYLSASSYGIDAKLVEGGTVLSYTSMANTAFTSGVVALHMEAIVTPAAASHTYKVQAFTYPSTAGGGAIDDSGTYGPGYVIVEDIGV